MTLWPELASAAAASMLGSCAIGVALAGLLAGLPRVWLTGARHVLLALLIPAACLAAWPDLRHGVIRRLGLGLPGVSLWPPPHLVLGTLPLLLLPVLNALARMPPGQRRAATGLGAGWVAILRLVWLPQLGPSILLGVLLAALLDVAALRLSS